MPIKNWSPTPASNNSAAPFGCPEGWSPSSVNDWGRQTMGDIRTQFENAEWFDYGTSGLSRASATSFKVTGDLTSEYIAGRRLKCNDATTLYGAVASSSYSAPDTTINVTLDSGSLTTSLTAVALSILRPTNTAIPAFSNLATTGTSSLSGAVTLKTTLNVEGATTLSGNAVAKGTFLVEGATTLVGATTMKGAVTHEAATVCKTTLNVEGATSLSGNAVLKGALNVEGATTLSGATTIKGITTHEAATVLKTTLNVEGATTLSGAVVCKSTLTVNGTSVTGSGDWVKISTGTASASATIDFTNLSSTYIAYVVVVNNLEPSTTASLRLRVSTNNGSSYNDGGGGKNYDAEFISGFGGVVDSTSNVDTSSIQLTSSFASNFAGMVYIFNPSASARLNVSCIGVNHATSDSPEISYGGGANDTVEDVDAIRFLLSTGTMTSGTFTLYGIKA